MKNKKIYSCGSSFVLSFLGITIIFILLKIIGGNLSMFEGDDFQQYLVFATDFVNIIKGNGSIWYSFANYIGSGNILTVAYYCLSPFNIFFLLCGDNFYLAFYLVVALKLAIAAAAFSFFIIELTKCNRGYYIVASVFYALSGYAVTWYFDIMWLDALYILPILIAFIIRYVEKNSFVILLFIYAYLFITNFYMGYIVGVFSALFFVSFLLYRENYQLNGRIIYYIKKCLGFGGVVLLSAGVCAGLLLPVGGFLSEHMAHDNIAFESLVANLLDIINSMYVGEFQTMDNKVPVLYAGLPSMALFFFFLFNKNINAKEKVFWGFQILFYVFGMLILPLYKFLHAFDYPNYYGYRFSFVVVFLMLSVSCCALDYLKADDIIFFKWFIIVSTLFYSFMMTYQAVLFAGNRLNSQSGLLVNFAFELIWISIFFVIYIKQKHLLFFKKVAVAIALLETIVNGYICINSTDFVHIEKSLINGWYYGEKQAINTIKDNDDSFYRVYVNNDVNTNSGKMFGFNGLNTFSSSDNYELRMALSKLGQSTSNRYMRANCSVPAFDSLFAVKYYVDMPPFEEYIGGNIDNSNFMEATVSENEYALPLGYMVNNKLLEYSFSDNAFDNIERLCASMTGEECDFFKDIPLSDDIISLQNYQMTEIDGKIHFNKISDLYGGVSGVAFLMQDYNDNRYIEFSYDSPGSYIAFPTVYTDETGDYHSKLLGEGGIYKMGMLGSSNYVTVGNTGSAQSFYVDSINLAEFEEDKFIPIYENLESNSYLISVNTSDIISGTVTATEEKSLFFTTIPYDPEWHIYVDGTPVTRLYRVVGDAFMAIELAPGEHTVTFQYIEKWSNEGAIISLISITVLCIALLLFVLRKKSNNEGE